ncbi:glycosyltransferase family 9 protein [Neotamlana laminarinivorans]|uniref:Glycosyltransferase family 9 protein n=1 Tax=Neotamlana laminarinivorans TaxID=2883124 RepID=A0A9X1L135_9FLAO|nr:glycosyltransferase family 9 protein [Tamlana laminarinivorans]MCB4798343.1 glycosyltransferase family 9 protein [Tamlana laminarinivorans]
MSNSKHILVIRLSAMGDVAMTVPVLRALTKQYPELKITVLTRAFFAPFFRDLQNVEVLAADVKGKHKGVLGLYKLSQEIKTLGVDAVADLHNVLRSKILKFFLSGKPFYQIDKGRNEKKALISGVFFKPLKTTHRRYADVFKSLGFPIDLSNPSFPKNAILNNKCEALLGDLKSKRIGIAPFAAHEGKMYPFRLMKEVIETLAKQHKIYLFGGGKQEIEVLNNISEAHENVQNLAGKLSLNEELDVISNLDVMLSMDSGNAHIAAMLGVKVITIWGVTHPFAGFAPFNQPEDYALVADRAKYPLIPTSIYGNKHPEDYKNAAGSVSPKTIVEKLESVL